MGNFNFSISFINAELPQTYGRKLPHFSLGRLSLQTFMTTHTSIFPSTLGMHAWLYWDFRQVLVVKLVFAVLKSIHFKSPEQILSCIKKNLIKEITLSKYC